LKPEAPANGHSDIPSLALQASSRWSHRFDWCTHRGQDSGRAVKIL